VYPEIASEGVDGNPIFAFTTETQHIWVPILIHIFLRKLQEPVYASIHGIGLQRNMNNNFNKQDFIQIFASPLLKSVILSAINLAKQKINDFAKTLTLMYILWEKKSNPNTPWATQGCLDYDAWHGKN
jgi:hypothetical protein